MSKLPPTPPTDNPHVVRAYGVCLCLEEQIQMEIAASKGNTKKARMDELTQLNQLSLMYCRILGYLLHHAPTDRARTTVVREIVSCGQDRGALLDVGKLYYDYFIQAWRTPTPSNHASCPSFDTLADMMKDMMESAPQDHSSTKKKALVRDGFRCVLSGGYDLPSVEANAELREKALADDASLLTTQCAHIIPVSIVTGLERGSDKEHYATSVSAIFECFGYKNVPSELNGSGVHRLQNVITLDLSLHIYFDTLKIWLVVTGDPDKYQLKSSPDYLAAKYPKYVTFTSPDHSKLPLPSREYLALHAACAQVAHFSGAAKYIEKVFRDMEECKVLSADGASAAILEQAVRATAFSI